MKPRDVVWVIFLPAAFVLLAGCIPDSPEAPEWEVDITVPLMNDRLVLFEELEGEEGFYVDTLDIGGIPTEVLGFSFDAELDPVELIDYVEIEDQESTPTIYQPSDFEIHIAPGTLQVDIPFVSLWPEAASHHGELFPVPPIPLVELNDMPAGRFADYNWADIREGGFTVRVENGLPFDLDTCDMTVKDDEGNAFDDYLLGPVTENGSAEESKPIEEQYITNVLLLDFAAASTEGSGGVHVQIDTSASVSLRFHYDEIMILNGAEIRAYRFENSLETVHRIATDSVMIDELVFAAGSMDVTVRNDLTFDVGADITLAEFTKNGVPLEQEGVFPAGGEEILVFDLAGVTFAPAAPPPRPDSMDITADVDFTALIDDTLFIAINTGDRVSVSYSLSGAEFSSFDGEVLSPQEMADERMETGIDEDIPVFIAEYLGISLSADNETGFSPDVHLSLTGLDENGLVLAEADIPSFTIPAGAEDETVLDLQNDVSILDVFNSRPDTVVFTGLINAGDGDVSAGEELRATVTLGVPLILAFETDTLESEEADDITLDEETRDLIEENALYLGAFVTVESYLPVGVMAACFFGTDSASILDNPDLRLPGAADDYYAVEAGELSQDGLVIAPSTSTWEIELNHDQILTFTRDPLFFINRIIIPGTGGETVAVQPDDYIEVSAYIAARARTPFGD